MYDFAYTNVVGNCLQSSYCQVVVSDVHFFQLLVTQVDVAVIEVGIGGQYDSTNIIR